MTEEQMEVYRKVFAEDKKRRQEQKEKYKQEVIKRCEEGRAYSYDWQYYYEAKGIIPEEAKNKIAHQDEKIAHPDTMQKSSATILLIIGMIGSLIFKQWYFIWALLLLWYFSQDRV